MEYRHLTETSPTSILVVRNNRIIYANPAFLVFSGYKDAEIIGQNLIFFIDPSDHQEFTRFAKNWANETLEPGRGEFHFITKSGQIRVAIVLTTPIMAR